jgi:hypothetical protein
MAVQVIMDVDKVSVAGPVFVHGTTGAKRKVGAPINKYFQKKKMRSFAIL